MNSPGIITKNNRRVQDLFLYNRWPWHAGFWLGYILFRFYVYYITVTHYPTIFLEFMLLSEILFAAMVYITLSLYKRWFAKKKYTTYFTIGVICWVLYLYARTKFQAYYLQNAPGFKITPFSDILINNITGMIIYLLFITACKYFKDGFISQQFEAERKEEQLRAEVNDLKSQIAPHFLFNTLNNLYGLAVEKSDKLPDLMLKLSNLLRHSLYETQKPLVSINDEINVLKSYIQLESIRLENDLKLKFDDNVPAASPYQIAPLILIVFMENAFKHSKLVKSAPVNIYISTAMDDNIFILSIKN